MALELAFEVGTSAGTVGADGHMDFFERGLLKPAEPGQLLGRWLSCDVEPGVRSASKLRLGAGVVFENDGSVRATRAGVVLYKPGDLLDVVAEHVHQGAVDLRTGHLDMHGSLVVKGDVERLLQVRATGDLEVLGSVSGGSLRAGGSIRVSGSVRGGDGSSVVATHDATIKSCESANVSAGGKLSVQEAVSSELCGGELVVTGRLRGGSANAERRLSVKEAGTATGMVTELRAGEPVTLPDSSEVQRAVMMQKLRRMAERGGVRDAFGGRGGRAKGGKLGRLNAALSAEELRERAEHAEQRALLERSAVIELGLGHAGVALCIGRARLLLEQDTRGLRYALDSETGQLRAERTLR
ncbi:MAG TPA: FapA family protein [Polyangiaceae bacterium]|nr:FapA family protein [Polyangiaceae bacterium]